MPVAIIQCKYYFLIETTSTKYQKHFPSHKRSSTDNETCLVSKEKRRGTERRKKIQKSSKLLIPASWVATGFLDKEHTRQQQSVHLAFQGKEGKEKKTETLENSGEKRNLGIGSQQPNPRDLETMDKKHVVPHWL
ncbi:hypothetical protein AVEN_206953-1 [Araneus ventricosus]|uniref:Uncharacterized protein n=1 Tax=Araneus ventricosus TaxID=182803 RepID=A0A4Y2L627_ARAVE|nr:hypothetical protein AVEN_206953-1 [Araneus ventricosus]